VIKEPFTEYCGGGGGCLLTLPDPHRSCGARTGGYLLLRDIPSSMRSCAFGNIGYLRNISRYSLTHVKTRRSMAHISLSFCFLVWRPGERSCRFKTFNQRRHAIGDSITPLKLRHNHPHASLVPFPYHLPTPFFPRHCPYDTDG